MTAHEAHFHLIGGERPIVERFDSSWSADEVVDAVDDALDDDFVMVGGRDGIAMIFIRTERIERAYVVEAK